MATGLRRCHRYRDIPRIGSCYPRCLSTRKNRGAFFAASPNPDRRNSTIVPAGTRQSQNARGPEDGYPRNLESITAIKKHKAPKANPTAKGRHRPSERAFLAADHLLGGQISLTLSTFLSLSRLSNANAFLIFRGFLRVT